MKAASLTHSSEYTQPSSHRQFNTWQCRKSWIQHWQVSFSTLVPNCPVFTGVEEVGAVLILVLVLVQWGWGRLHFWTNCCFSLRGFVDAISLYVKLFSHVTARTALESIMTSVWPFWGFWTINPEVVWNRLECWAINRSGMSSAGSHWAAEWSGTNDWHSRTADAGEINFHCLHFEILPWPLQPTFQDYLDICCVGFKKLINPRWPEVWQSVLTAALVSG